MNKYIEYFTNYVKDNYDINNELVIKKYYHSLRVAKLMVILADKLNLDDENKLLAFKIGLCHDLGRFHEAIRIGGFDNNIFDHGAYSNKILYNDSFVKYMDVDEHLLFRKAIYCHNKKDLDANLTYREAFFANLLRDADKIDLLRQRVGGKKLNFNVLPTKIVLNNYLDNHTININDINNQSDSIILYLSFIKDLVFEESFDMMLSEGYYDELLQIIDVASDKEDLFFEIINKIKERRGKKYVR